MIFKLSTLIYFLSAVLSCICSAAVATQNDNERTLNHIHKKLNYGCSSGFYQTITSSLLENQEVNISLAELIESRFKFKADAVYFSSYQDVCSRIDDAFIEGCFEHSLETERFVNQTFMANHPFKSLDNDTFLFKCTEFLNSDIKSLNVYLRFLGTPIFKKEVYRIYQEFLVDKSSGTLSFLRNLYFFDKLLYGFELIRKWILIAQLFNINADAVFTALLIAEYTDFTDAPRIVIDFFIKNHRSEMEYFYFKIYYDKRLQYPKTADEIIDNLSPSNSIRSLLEAILDVTAQNPPPILASFFSDPVKNIPNLNLFSIAFSISSPFLCSTALVCPFLIKAIRKLEELKPGSINEIFPHQNLASIIFSLESFYHSKFNRVSIYKCLINAKKYLARSYGLVIEKQEIFGFLESLESFSRHFNGFFKFPADRSFKINLDRILVPNPQVEIHSYDSDSLISSTCFYHRMLFCAATDDRADILKYKERLDKLNIWQKVNLIITALAQENEELAYFFTELLDPFENERRLFNIFEAFRNNKLGFEFLSFRILQNCPKRLQLHFASNFMLSYPSESSLMNFYVKFPWVIKFDDNLFKNLFEFRTKDFLESGLPNHVFCLSAHFKRNLYLFKSYLYGYYRLSDDAVEPFAVIDKERLRAIILLFGKKFTPGFNFGLQPLKLNRKVFDFLLNFSIRLGGEQRLKELMRFGQDCGFSKKALLEALLKAKAANLINIQKIIKAQAKKQFKKSKETV